MTAKEKCIAKWEKKLIVAEKILEKYGSYWATRQRTESNIVLIKETIKDLKRL